MYTIISNEEYVLKLHDIIKLGRMTFQVTQISTPQNKENPALLPFTVPDYYTIVKT